MSDPISRDARTDAAMLKSMAASFRARMDLSFNPDDMADLMERCAEAVKPGPLSLPPAQEAARAELKDALVRCREIALQAEAAPLSMCEIVNRVDMALGEDSATPKWMKAAPAEAGPRDWRADCVVLLANLDALIELTGEAPEDEDGLMLAEIRAAIARGVQPAAPAVKVKPLVAAIEALPRRKEKIGGQTLSYVKLGDVIANLAALEGGKA